jgi:antitoxin VapB
MADDEAHARVFWSGGSQAVRLPKAMRLPGRDVLIRRKGKTLVIEPILPEDDWRGFWDGLLPLKHPVKRGRTRPAEKRKRL